jgi:hypothetical protein
MPVPERAECRGDMSRTERELKENIRKSIGNTGCACHSRIFSRNRAESSESSRICIQMSLVWIHEYRIVPGPENGKVKDYITESFVVYRRFCLSLKDWEFSEQSRLRWQAKLFVLRYTVPLDACEASRGPA